MHTFAADAKRIQLDLLVSDEQAPLLADCMRLGKVGRPTILSWKKQHEDAMAHAAEEKAKVKAVSGTTRKAPFAADEGEEELEEEDTGAGSDAMRVVLYMSSRRSRHIEGKGRGKVRRGLSTLTWASQ
jgi:hypothetical protein